MPSKSFGKIQKQISKKRGGKPTALHEKSRDAQRLQRASKRDHKLDKKRQDKYVSLGTYMLRMDYYRSCVQEGHDGTFDDKELLELTKAYVKQHDEEIEEVAAARRPGRPPSSRETDLKQRKKDLEREFSAGFWAPDLKDETTAARLREWKNDWPALEQMRFVRIDETGNARPSRFPPSAG